MKRARQYRTTIQRSLLVYIAVSLVLMARSGSTLRHLGRGREARRPTGTKGYILERHNSASNYTTLALLGPAPRTITQLSIRLRLLL